jgi:hypothetical protein
MSEIEILRVCVDILKFHVATRVVSHIMEHHHQFSQESITLYWWFELSSDENLDRPIVFENIVELIKHGLIVIFNKLLASFLLVLNCNRLLPLLSWQFLSFLALLHLKLILDSIPGVVHLDSFLLILDLIRLFLVGNRELFGGLGLRPKFLLFFSTDFFLMSRFVLFDHCCCIINNKQKQAKKAPLCFVYNNKMEPTYGNKEIIWAKVKGYPWWPAKVRLQ